MTVPPEGSQSTIAEPSWFDSVVPRRPGVDLVQRIRRFHQVGHRGVLVTLLVATAMTPVLHDVVPLHWLLTWLAAVWGIGALRLLVFAVVRRWVHEPAALRCWARVSVIGSGLQGVAWVPLLLFIGAGDGSLPLALLIGVVLGLFVTGIVSLVGLYPPVYWAYVIPVVAAVGVWLLWHPDGQPAMVAALGLAVTFMLMGAVESSRHLRRSVSRRRETQHLAEGLGVEKRRFQYTLASIGDAVITTDAEGAIDYMNAAAEALTGWSFVGASGRRLQEVVALTEESPGNSLDVLVETCLARGTPVHRSDDAYLHAGRRGDERVVQVGVSPIQEEPGETRGLVAVIRDVTELRGMARQVRYQNRFDSLTGLPNRGEFETQLDAELSRRSSGLPVVCWFDLDRFKLVNDSCGHTAGDELLRQVAEQIVAYLRQGDLLARVGSDEFALLLRDTSLDEATELAGAIRDHIAGFRFAWGGRVFNPGASVGVVPAARGETAGTLLAAADAACYVAKEQGPNQLHVAYPDDIALATRNSQVEWATRVQAALDENRFRLRFQRLQALQPELPEKVELLVSMVDEQGGIVSPGQFLPAAELFGMMPALDRRVVALALDVINNPPPALGDVDQFAINLSGQSLNDPAFLGFVLETLRETGVDASRICFEITETAVISNLARAQEFIAALAEHGCRFSLDDFGSGLSSFGYLRALNVDYLKVDGQFVRDLASDSVDQSMVRCINQVGHTIGMLTVAEFVESGQALEQVRALGVDYAQGYAVHRPEFL
ncbi:PAS domain S-box-containing protein/diguanylate cyclase (GGDEF) domain-containing protein [Aquisalimonas asiatica]|uniref:PAS domain S-box-containing protein/diguanylate cyclase (GGDEF) domain-containing protein n=1 Tax=Aquisalimonas asiatica TaxID=406100 RepID=A0A1H8SSD5_9GAMM|nr:PAS domain S-box-containing protein/diguanylate cyclase (GGDEF) domain-containing protein [Aquisalimonas asiatica]